MRFYIDEGRPGHVSPGRTYLDDLQRLNPDDYARLSPSLKRDDHGIYVEIPEDIATMLNLIGRVTLIMPRDAAKDHGGGELWLSNDYD